jgi:Tfp pilus assembly protein PilX
MRLQSQRGATLAVGLIMLTLITVLVTSAFNLSTTNLAAVGNMQFRDEAIAGANKAIEQVLSSPFTDAPTGQAINVDIDNDDAPDYEVVFSAPTCISDSEIVNNATALSSVTLGSSFSVIGSTFHETIWDLSATVTDTNRSGASVQVHQGVRVLLTKAQYDAVCR